MRYLLKIAFCVALPLSGTVALAQKLPQPLCEQAIGRCVDPAKPYAYSRRYVGHDEPSLLFYSNKAGSGNSSVYLLRLPTDPPTLPNQQGTGGTFNFQLHPAFWAGMAMCDTQSFPEFTDTCVPDTDSNIFDNRDPDASDYLGRHPGTAFMEMQFYPPGWAPFQLPGGISCDATKWCGALNIDSLGFDPASNLDNNNACLSTVGEETVNFAFITKSGVPHAPPSPVNSTLATFTPDPRTDLFMNSGDLLRVTLRDTAEGFRVVVEDLTTGETGSMTASAANGFGQVKFDPLGTTCENIPYTFHPMYSTSGEHTRVPWAAHSYNVAFSDEIGHFEYCDAVNAQNGKCTKPGVSDPKGVDSDDVFCLKAKDSTRIQISGCVGVDLDFDGPPYRRDWPGTLSNAKEDQLLNPSPIRFTSPLFISTDSNKMENYGQVAFETDLPSFQPFPPCDPFTGKGCTNPPEGANFYPLYTTTQAQDLGTCVWQLGGAEIPNTTHTFGGTSTEEFGPLILLFYQEPFGFFGIFGDFRAVLSTNPCSNTTKH